MIVGNKRVVMIAVISCLVSVVLLLEVVFLKREVRQLECDIGSGINAERQYTYPIFRDLGYDPEDYGVGINNPITTEEKYNAHCDW